MVEFKVDFEPISDKLKKLKKKDRVQFEAVVKKIEQIAGRPYAYKPLGNILKGRFRVHIGHFVLLFFIDYNEKVIEFIDYDHHKNIYKKYR